MLMVFYDSCAFPDSLLEDANNFDFKKFKLDYLTYLHNLSGVSLNLSN